MSPGLTRRGPSGKTAVRAGRARQRGRRRVARAPLALSVCGVRLRLDAVRAVRPLARRPVQRVGAVVERREARRARRAAAKTAARRRAARPSARAGDRRGQADVPARTARRGDRRDRGAARAVRARHVATRAYLSSAAASSAQTEPLLSHFLRHYVARGARSRRTSTSRSTSAPTPTRRARGAWPRASTRRACTSTSGAARARETKRAAWPLSVHTYAPSLVRTRGA